MKTRLLLALPLLLFAVLAVLLWHGIGRDPAARASALLATPFPAFALEDLDDPALRHAPSLLAGRVSLVNVWGAWCPTCRQEMPQLLDLASRGVRIIGVDYKDDRDSAHAFLDQFGNPFAVNVFDPAGSLGFDLGVYGAPESFIVDGNGVIRYHHTGYLTAQDVDRVIMPMIERLSP